MKTSKEICVAYIKAGYNKMKLSTSLTLLSSFFAGMFIALGGIGSLIGSVCVQDQSVAKMLSASVFPIGLAMVLISGVGLFTGNNLLIIPAIVADSDGQIARKRAMLRNLVLVYIGNLIGSLFTAFVIVYSHIPSYFSDQLAHAMVRTATTKAVLGFQDAFLRGIMCNILVCIAVWLSFAADDIAGKILALYVPVFLFVLCGFEHCVANMFFIPAGMMVAAEYGIQSASLTIGGFIHNQIPVLLGNLVGGMGIVGVGYAVLFRSDR